jgi:aspartate/methionine/tyrosine aminotransferase
MVTAGANQALVSLMLTLLDPSDRAVLFRPYYFNTLMAIQARAAPPIYFGARPASAGTAALPAHAIVGHERGGARSVP